MQAVPHGAGHEDAGRIGGRASHRAHPVADQSGHQPELVFHQLLHPALVRTPWVVGFFDSKEPTTRP